MIDKLFIIMCLCLLTCLPLSQIDYEARIKRKMKKNDISKRY